MIRRQERILESAAKQKQPKNNLSFNQISNNPSDLNSLVGSKPGDIERLALENLSGHSQLESGFVGTFS